MKVVYLPQLHKCWNRFRYTRLGWRIKLEWGYWAFIIYL